jgi:hypothetical protein
MSTVDQPRKAALPSLIPGQRLDQPTFHERYEAMPPETRAELVGGVVYMPSPLSYDHGDTESNVSYWLGERPRILLPPPLGLGEPLGFGRIGRSQTSARTIPLDMLKQQIS